MLSPVCDKARGASGVRENQPRIYVVGDRPGPNTDPERPMFPHTTTGSAQRLIDLMGVSRDWYLENTVRMNAWHDGEKLIAKSEAISRLGEKFFHIQQQCPLEFLILCVGQKSREIFPRKNIPDNAEVFYLPHTSGVNRFWNDRVATACIRLRLRSVISKTLGGAAPYSWLGNSFEPLESSSDTVGGAVATRTPYQLPLALLSL